jgi:hypothetical protein
LDWEPSNVCFKSKADICAAKRHVRFTPKADIRRSFGYLDDLLQFLHFRLERNKPEPARVITSSLPVEQSRG